jgi:hypothetical protein
LKGVNRTGANITDNHLIATVQFVLYPAEWLRRLYYDISFILQPDNGALQGKIYPFQFYLYRCPYFNRNTLAEIVNAGRIYIHLSQVPVPNL